MSEHDSEKHDAISGGITSLGEDAKELTDDYSEDGIPKYNGNLTQEKMTEIFKNWRTMKEIDWDNWEDFVDDFCCEDDSDTSKFARKFPSCQDTEEEFAYGPQCDPPFRARNRKEEMCKEKNESVKHSPYSVEDLIRKFSTIELLRQKHNLEKSEEDDSTSLKTATCSTHRHSAIKEDAVNPEELLGSKWHAKKRRDKWLRKEEEDEDSDEGTCPKTENDKDIDEIVQMLLSNSLISESEEVLTPVKKENYHDFNASSDKPREKGRCPYDDCCQTLPDDTTSSLSNSYENISETGNTSKPQMPSSEKPFDDHVTDLETDIAGNFCTIFGGYDIDNHSSFHDWMVNDILSKPLQASHDTEWDLCTVCFSHYGSEHVCIPLQD